MVRSPCPLLLNSTLYEAFVAMKSMGSDLCLAGKMGSIGHFNDTYHKAILREGFGMESVRGNLI